MRLLLSALLLIVVCLGICCAVIAPAQNAQREAAPARATNESAYRKEAGPYPVILKEIKLKDARRGRDIPICIRGPRLPAASTLTLPMVIFSHGAGGDSGTFPELCAHWASYGYVVVNPTHSDSVKLRREKGETFTRDRSAIANQIVRGVNLLDRRDDIRLILDSLPQIEAELAEANPSGTGAPGGRVRIDRERIAMAGHSAGAMTTQALAGVAFHGRSGRGEGLRFPEPRLKAFLVISGQGLGRPTFQKDSWQTIRAPMLVIAGSEDRSPVSDEKPEGRKDPYLYAPPGDKYLVFIEGATHGSYAGKSVTRLLGEKPPGNIGYITDITAFSTLAFLDAYLKDDKNARRYLQSDALTQYPGGKTEYQRK
jgi:predicted dienelactone hydrolase